MRPCWFHEYYQILDEDYLQSCRWPTCLCQPHDPETNGLVFLASFWRDLANRRVICMNWKQFFVWEADTWRCLINNLTIQWSIATSWSETSDKPELHIVSAFHRRYISSNFLLYRPIALTHSLEHWHLSLGSLRALCLLISLRLRLSTRWPQSQPTKRYWILCAAH